MPLDGDAPAWFTEALLDEPERSRIEVEDAAVELLTWGERGKPGIFFVHGVGGHADWWRFIAPFFSADHRVGAISWTGMGNSDWRDAYSFPQYRAEIMAGATAAGLFDGGRKPVLIAHSFGTVPAMLAAATYPDQFAGLVLLDTPLQRGVDVRQSNRTERGSPVAYVSAEEARARFRTLPATRNAPSYVLDFLATSSMRRYQDGEGGERVGWKFDPVLGRTLVRESVLPVLHQITCPLVMVRGQFSEVLSLEAKAWLTAKLPAHARWVEIPEAGHHVTLDQPLASVASLRAILAILDHPINTANSNDAAH